jgi:hypothetical protein
MERFLSFRRSSSFFHFVWFVFLIAAIILVVSVTQRVQSLQQHAASSSPIKTVFVIMLENHNWSGQSSNPTIQGSASAPYINNTLLPQSSYTTQYFNPAGIHPSEPNYIWLEAGNNFGVLDDNLHYLTVTPHLTTLLDKANVSWKSYQENISGTTCPSTDSGLYAVRHNPMMMFQDVTSNQSYCVAHVRPFSELATDLQNNTVPAYNFITPNLCDDMHNNSGCQSSDEIKNGDDWLAANVPAILNSQAYKNGGSLFIGTEEGEGNDGPIMMMVLSPFAKGHGYNNAIKYTHSSLLRTVQEIFGVTPLLGDAAKATDLSDLFSVSLSGNSSPTPTVVPSYVCGGTTSGICTTLTPTPTSGGTVSLVPSSGTLPTSAPSVIAPCTTSQSVAAVQEVARHHHTKRGTRSGRGFSNTLLGELLDMFKFLLSLIAQLLGNNSGIVTPTPSPSSPCPSSTPAPIESGITPSAGVSQTVVVTPTVIMTTIPSHSPSAVLGLHVQGNSLVDSQGKQVILHGVNRSGSEYSCVQGQNVFDGPSDAASIQAIAAWKANAVRVPMNEDCWLGINGVGVGGAAYQQAIKNYVNTITAAGLYVVLDLHWSAPGTTKATGQQVMADMDHSVAFWTSVAQTFKSSSNVIFDLYNEPQGISWSCWKNGGSSCQGAPFPIAGMQTLVNAVRAAGATNVVMLGGVGYSNDLSGWLANKPTDSANNLVASWHAYGKNACQDANCWNNQVGAVMKSVPIITGEFGESYDSSICGVTFDTALTNWLDAHKTGYLAWTWNTWGTSCGNLSLITNYNGTAKSPNGVWYKAHLAQF